MVEGVDYSWQRPSPARLYAEGKRFAIRYVSYDTTGKNITKPEADALLAAGVSPVTVWEENIDDAKGGYAAGKQHAAKAQMLHAAAGGPPDRPIYFAVDFDATPYWLPTCYDYLRGAAEAKDAKGNFILGYGRVGVYGGIKTIEYMADRGIKWLWQTYAWSYGEWDPRAHIHQYNNTEPVAGKLLDLCRSMKPDYGQWTKTSTPDNTVPQFIEQLIGLRRGAGGEPVRAFQRLLGRAGYPVVETGVYDAQTSDALLALRKAQGSSAINGDFLGAFAYGHFMTALVRKLTAQ